MLRRVLVSINRSNCTYVEVRCGNCEWRISHNDMLFYFKSVGGFENRGDYDFTAERASELRICQRDTPVTKQNYLHRMLFLDMYWVLLITLTLYYISPISIFILKFYRIYELQWLYHSSVFYILIKSFISFRCFICDCMCLCVWHILNKETTTTTTTTTTRLLLICDVGRLRCVELCLCQV